MIAFYQVFFSSQTKNPLSEVINVTPSPISDDIKECMEYSLTTGELAKDIGISFQVFVKKCLQDRNYISKYINMPYLTNTSLTYTTQTHYHLSPIDENFEQLKKKSTLWFSFHHHP